MSPSSDGTSRPSEASSAPRGFFCRLCGQSAAVGYDLAMGRDGPPGTFACPACRGRALDEYTLMPSLGVIRDTHSLCECGAASPLRDRGNRFCFRCGRKQ